jgi:hypothetical protein
VQNDVRVFRTKQKVDLSSQKIDSQPLSLKLHVQSSGKTSKMATSHPAEGIGGDAFVGGGVSTLLVVGDGTLIWPRDRSSTAGFGRLFLWPIKKTNPGSVEHYNYNMETTCLCGTSLVQNGNARMLPTRPKINYPSIGGTPYRNSPLWLSDELSRQLADWPSIEFEG